MCLTILGHYALKGEQNNLLAVSKVFDKYFKYTCIKEPCKLTKNIILACPSTEIFRARTLRCQSCFEEVKVIANDYVSICI